MRVGLPLPSQAIGEFWLMAEAGFLFMDLAFRSIDPGFVPPEGHELFDDEILIEDSDLKTKVREFLAGRLLVVPWDQPYKPQFTQLMVKMDKENVVVDVIVEFDRLHELYNFVVDHQSVSLRNMQFKVPLKCGLIAFLLGR